MPEPMKQMKPLNFIEIKNDILRKIIKDKAFKAALIQNPKEILTKEYDITFPSDTEVKVIEDTEQLIHFVIPVIPEGKLTDAQLNAIAGGSCPPSNKSSSTRESRSTVTE